MSYFQKREAAQLGKDIYANQIPAPPPTLKRGDCSLSGELEQLWKKLRDGSTMVTATSATLVTRILSQTRMVDHLNSFLQLNPLISSIFIPPTNSRGLFLRGIATAPLYAGPRDLLSRRTLDVARAKMPWHLAFINVCRNCPLGLRAMWSPWFFNQFRS